MLAMFVSLRRVAVAGGVVLLALLTAAWATADSATATQPQQRQIAETTLSSFKVVLTAARVGTSPNATVTAAGYRMVAGNWEPTGQQRIGAAGAWSWDRTEVCGLTVTELKPEPRSAVLSETLTVSLLISPARGCSRNFSESWETSPPPMGTATYVADGGSTTVAGFAAP
jgi:hypothetical protein